MKKACPAAFGGDLIHWKMVAQTGCDDLGSCSKYVHGFRITYRPKVDAEEEINMVKEMVDGHGISPKMRIEVEVTKEGEKCRKIWDRNAEFKGGDAALNAFLEKEICYPASALKDHKSAVLKIMYLVDEEGEVKDLIINVTGDDGFEKKVREMFRKMPIWKPALKSGEPVASYQHMSIDYSMESARRHKVEIEIYDTASMEYIPASAERVYSSFLSDSTLDHILTRNDHWNNMAVVCDVTGSMAPYTAQLLIWLQLNAKDGKIKHYSFFNDGDNKPDRNKKVGEVGGIHHGVCSSYDDIEELAYMSMRKGSGGDISENNMEAVLSAVESCPNCDRIVMIADNFATPRDLELANKLEKPIHIVICGAWGGLNTAYLDLARQTNGSIHTMETDLANLMEINERGECRS